MAKASKKTIGKRFIKFVGENINVGTLADIKSKII